MKAKLRSWLVVLIVVVGGIVRFYGLDRSPPSLGFDEASLGYNAYSIMKTGKDEYGNFLPISLRSFNDFKPALYAYLSIPFIYFGGLNGAMVRMVSAVAGTVSLIFLYWLLRKYIKNKWLAVGLFLWLSFEPWRLHFSRNAFETHLSMALFTIGCWWLLEKKKKWHNFWAILFLGLAAYSYHSARLAGPLLLLFWWLDPIRLARSKNFFIRVGEHFKRNWKKLGLLAGLILICMPIFMANSSNLVLTRFNQENVFQRFFPYAPKEFANPISGAYYLMGIISGHVFSNLSPINLNYRIFKWVKMSPQFIPGMGMLGWIEGLVFMVGLVTVIKRIRLSAKYRFLVYWVVAGAAPSAATWTWFHPLRSLNIYPAMEIIVALGFEQIVEWWWRTFIDKKIRLITGAMAIIVLATTIVFTINNELLYSAYENHGEYQPGGYKEGMPYLKSIQDDYDQVIIDTPHAQPFVFLMFYEQMDPTFVQKYADIRPKPGTEGNLIFSFGKFTFRKVDWPKDQSLKRTVFWVDQDIPDKAIEIVPNARLRMKVNNALYHTADIITTE